MTQHEITTLRGKLLSLLQVWIDVFEPNEELLHYHNIERWADTILADITDKLFKTYELGSRWTDKSELKIEQKTSSYIRYTFEHNIPEPVRPDESNGDDEYVTAIKKFEAEKVAAKAAKKLFKQRRNEIFHTKKEKV